MRTTRTLACFFAVALALPPAVHAQDRGAAVPAPDVSFDEEVQAARDRLHLLLLRPDVRQTARAQGIDLRRIHDGVDHLPPSALARIAPYARAVESAEAQSAITISTTTIIIVLLALIVLLLIT